MTVPVRESEARPSSAFAEVCQQRCIHPISSSLYALSCHASIDDLPPSQSASILHALESMLSEKYRIGHTAIQFESHAHQETYCSVDGLYCSMETIHGSGEHNHDPDHDHEEERTNPLSRRKEPTHG